MRRILLSIALGVLFIASAASGAGYTWTGNLKYREKITYIGFDPSAPTAASLDIPNGTLDSDYATLSVSGAGLSAYPFRMGSTRPFQFLVYRSLNAEVDPLIEALGARITEVSGLDVLSPTAAEVNLAYLMEKLQVTGTLRFDGSTGVKGTITLRYSTVVTTGPFSSKEVRIAQKFQFSGESVL